ncbi:uncharacterized protein LOC143293735 [Babylonia areolata]|uniref:uncharacterized protein LOC143293735 n=1 Tax=Babylonia areolata TaxID=304850 RepID=UPI003FD12105
MTSTSEERRVRVAEESTTQPEIFRLTPLSDREEGGSQVEVHTSTAPLSARERKALDELAKLFTVQEERSLSEAARKRESSQLSKTSLSSSSTSQIAAADAAFIYQHIDYGVLSRCVPGFVKSNVNRNCRYLPETFILRVNYWRRRRMIGDDSSVKRAKRETVVRACAELGTSASSGAAAKARSPRPPTVMGARQTARSS